MPGYPTAAGYQFREPAAGYTSSTESRSRTLTGAFTMEVKQARAELIAE